MSLEEYLDAAEIMLWRWGYMDCCCFGANWALEKTGIDPFGSFRGSYRTAKEARSVIRKYSGLQGLVSHCMSTAGFAETAVAETGDIAVIGMPAGGRAAVAGAAVVIRHGPWWIGKALHGLIGFSGPAQKIWRVK